MYNQAQLVRDQGLHELLFDSGDAIYMLLVYYFYQRVKKIVSIFNHCYCDDGECNSMQ